ncbi:transcription factor bHLH149-like [Nymphaea colorata]|uniref:transcription factor bHLH149-like n=1 Tax=Nymphaea colorata TaxID=210225 RepID=UPI00129E813E|nr:transcription factor bHLH149-like [Nymphaea colorata]
MDSVAQKLQTKWKTGSQHRNYACKLVKALRHIRRSASAAPPYRAFRETADRTLAIAAKGRTRWSRAILRRAANLNITRKARMNHARARSSWSHKMIGLRRADTKKPMLHRRLQTLGRLVPGCRKLPLPAILDEASDYIAALEMQVKAMRAIAGLLSTAAVAEVDHPEPVSGPLRFNGEGLSP